jgi:hypothetical protein
VAASMRSQGLGGRPKRRFHCLTRPDKAAIPFADLVNRDFSADGDKTWSWYRAGPWAQGPLSFASSSSLLLASSWARGSAGCWYPGRACGELSAARTGTWSLGNPRVAEVADLPKFGAQWRHNGPIWRAERSPSCVTFRRPERRIFRRDPRACVKGRSLSCRPSGPVWFRLVFHSPRRPRRLQAVLTGAGEQGACWILTGGTFEQLEDSRERTASRAATVGNILRRLDAKGGLRQRERSCEC